MYSLSNSVQFLEVLSVMWFSVPDVFWFCQKQNCFSFSLYSLSHFPSGERRIPTLLCYIWMSLFLFVPDNKGSCTVLEDHMELSFLCKFCLGISGYFWEFQGSTSCSTNLASLMCVISNNCLSVDCFLPSCNLPLINFTTNLTVSAIFWSSLF